MVQVINLFQQSQISLAPKVPDGKSIRELWSSDYSYILVKNLQTSEAAFVFGNDGVIEVSEWGKVKGRYATQTRDGKYVYRSRSLPIKNADFQIWKRISFALRKEVILQRSTPPIPGAHTLVDLINASAESQLFVQCVPEGKCFVIDIKSRGYRNIEPTFWGKEIDVDTGEEISSNSYDYYHPRRKLQIWKTLK